MKRNHDSAVSEGTAENTEESRSTGGNTEEKGTKWAENFQARKAEEAVSNNCLNIDSSTKEHITMKVFHALLEDGNAKKITVEGRGEFNMGGETVYFAALSHIRLVLVRYWGLVKHQCIQDDLSQFSNLVMAVLLTCAETPKQGFQMQMKIFYLVS